MGYVHGIRWSDELVKQKIDEVMMALCIERMPSEKECTLVTGNGGLSNKIAKSGGFEYWAKKLGLELKKCETRLGKEYEEFLMNGLIMQGWKVERMSTKHPYDLLVNDNIKVDVKAARRYYYDDKNYYYTFNLEKRNPTCDIYVCFCLNDNFWVEKLLIIPSKFLHLTQLSLGAKSEYDKFDRRYDYLSEYDKFYKSLIG